MNIEEFRLYCLGKAGTTEEFPFNASALVFKVVGKMYALTDIDLFESINLKCDPERALELREKYPCVRPGYHMNKKHWNTLTLDGTMSDQEVYKWIDHSYELVVAKLPKAQREKLNTE
ncbi:MmcQ/YjbR family DNA-binding protein [Xanthovirga aplysinae]|uniref:MmcQ/YjbR family DNA-binding protein n=1 Tax=Xanthovirga aplysinae TaxID=2529853 RepID=UPI0012BD6DFB|nr:MmcQ/YjbR family DNA-binding protein [Xanthovirga aplysinae]MTI31152.1 MmcQ/YjbR family DNA-binding protein [Xanthovirga aplysinae]